MESTAASGWSDFLVAAASATGTLAGLVFVALSINLARIVSLPSLPGRAAETIILLAGALASTLVALVPHLTPWQRGSVLLLIALPVWLVPMGIQIRSVRAGADRDRWRVVSRLLLHQFATLPAVMCGLSLCGFVRGGIGWLAIAVVASSLVGMLNAWILLVEIVR